MRIPDCRRSCRCKLPLRRWCIGNQQKQVPAVGGGSNLSLVVDVYRKEPVLHQRQECIGRIRKKIVDICNLAAFHKEKRATVLSHHVSLGIDIPARTVGLSVEVPQVQHPLAIGVAKWIDPALHRHPTDNLPVLVFLVPSAWRHMNDPESTTEAWVLAVVVGYGLLLVGLFGAIALQMADQGLLVVGFSLQLMFGLWMFVRLLTRPN